MGEADSDNYTTQQQVTRIVATIDQPDKFAEIFCAAAKSQKSIDASLKEIVKSLLEHDKETRLFIKMILRESEKEDLLFQAKKIFSVGWAVLLLAIGAILQALSRHLLP